MNWGAIFGKIVLERGRKYYDAGKVKNLRYENEMYQADVRGTYLYHVKVGIQGNTIRSMECTCPAAEGGRRCKHMAATLIAIERQRAQARMRERGGLPAIGELPEAETVSGEDEKVVIPFPYEEEEGGQYRYYSMSRMTEGMTFTKGICDQAQRMISKGQVRLNKVKIGYSRTYGSNESMGLAVGEADSSGRPAEVSVSFQQEKIREATCRVPGCSRYFNSGFQYSGYAASEKEGSLCVHQTALLYLLDHYIQEYNPGDATDYEGDRILRQFRKYKGTMQAAALQAGQCLTLEPRLENSKSGLRVSFRIGAGERPYLIKNLTELVQAVEANGEMEFGTRLKVNFANSSFAEDVYPYYAFIRQAVKEEQQRTDMARRIAKYDSYGTDIKGSIDVYGTRLDQLYEAMKGHAIEYQDSTGLGTFKWELELREKAPKLTMVVRKDTDQRGIFRGIQVTGSLPELWEGVTHQYYVDEEYLNRVPQGQLRELRPLYQDQGMSDGKICFRVGRKHLAEFYYSMLPMLRRYGTVEEPDCEELARYLPPEVSFLFYLDAEERNVTCRGVAVYGEQQFSLMDLVRSGFAGVKEEIRDGNREREAVSQILSFFPVADPGQDVFHCNGEEDRVYEVLEHGLDALLALGEVHTTESFRRLHVRRRPKISIGVSVASDIMNLDISSEDISREELMEILRSYRQKKKFYRLKNGDFLTMEEENLELLSQLMEDLRLSPGEFVKGKMQLPMYRALYLDQMLARSEGLYPTRDSRFKKLVKEFKTVNDSEYEVPADLRPIMRKYQITGYRWLRTLAAYGFGGILADDMGLGKTLQMISVLSAHKKEGGVGTSLIVTPASLVYNWQEEFRRYAPELSVCLVVGTQTERAAKVKRYTDYDVVVTSYDLLKRDIAEYEACRFVYQVLDEAQYIKNHSTAASKAVKVIRSGVRYALTGTPIENRLSELWSIFDYLMPGFLYSYEVFKKELETPVTKNKDEEAAVRLKKMVSPFILRRLKQDVLKDLPDKLEETRYARLTSQQQKLYDAQVLHMRDMIQAQSPDSFQKNRMQILAELTKIRQICCDPSLFLEEYAGGSAKREACLDLIHSAMEGEHKILLFSQFTSMLELLEQDLIKDGIAYYKITGATPKEQRTQMVRQFNEDSTPLFLISLKAGGTGLNLTGADVVIHYDPWWNLAVQNQATDRAHRIGQTKVVSVYKLIVKDSVEEKIQQMQEAKRDLADQILSGEGGNLAAMSKEELLALLQE